MKNNRLLLSLALIIAMTLLGFCGCESEESEEPANDEPKYEASIEVECVENILFSKYDVNIVIEEETIGTLEHGKTDSFICKLTEGEHEVVFQEEEDSTVDGVGKIIVKKDGANKFGFKISCSSDQIDVETIDVEKQEADAAAEKAVQELEGKTIEDAIKVSEETGYTFTYTHSVSYEDFTESVEAAPEDFKTWLIMELGYIDTEEKTAELYVNAKENQERIDKEKEQSDTLSSKLDDVSALTAVELYGKDHYPYGFSLSMLTADVSLYDEDTWQVSGTCKVTNEYGTKGKFQCIARVTGTNDNPEVIYFEVR